MYVMSSRELDIQSRLLLEVYAGEDPTHTFAYIRLHNVKNPMLIDDLARTEPRANEGTKGHFLHLSRSTLIRLGLSCVMQSFRILIQTQ